MNTIQEVYTSNTTSVTVNPTVQSTGTSYTSGKSTYQIYADGWGHTSLTPQNLSSSTQSLTLNYPEQELIRQGMQEIYLHLELYRQIISEELLLAQIILLFVMGSIIIENTAGAAFTNLLYVWFGGHWGTQTSIFVTSPPPAYGTPFAYINTAAESNTPATTIRMNQSSNASNGFVSGRYAISHNNSTIGNYTQFWLLVEVTLSGVLAELGLMLFYL